jgi:hypothetical protein
MEYLKAVIGHLRSSVGESMTITGSERVGPTLQLLIVSPLVQASESSQGSRGRESHRQRRFGTPTTAPTSLFTGSKGPPGGGYGGPSRVPKRLASVSEEGCGS